MIITCVLVGGCLGAIIGAAVQSSEKGKKMNDAMEAGWKTWSENLEGIFPLDQFKGFISKEIED